MQKAISFSSRTISITLSLFVFFSRVFFLLFPPLHSLSPYLSLSFPPSLSLFPSFSLSLIPSMCSCVCLTLSISAPLFLHQLQVQLQDLTALDCQASWICHMIDFPPREFIWWKTVRSSLIQFHSYHVILKGLFPFFSLFSFSLSSSKDLDLGTNSSSHPEWNTIISTLPHLSLFFIFFHFHFFPIFFRIWLVSLDRKSCQSSLVEVCPYLHHCQSLGFGLCSLHFTLIWSSLPPFHPCVSTYNPFYL